MKPVKVGTMALEQYRIVDLIQNARRKKPVALATQFDILIGREHEFDQKTTG